MSLRHPAVLWLSWLAHVKVLQLNVWVAGKKGERLTTHFVVCMTWACSSYASKHSLVYPPPLSLAYLLLLCFLSFPSCFPLPLLHARSLFRLNNNVQQYCEVCLLLGLCGLVRDLFVGPTMPENKAPESGWFSEPCL